MSELSALNSAVAKIKRFVNKTVVSGTFTDTELEYYLQDANSIVDLDLPDYGTYTITVGSGIKPEPTDADLTLLSMQAAILVYTSIMQESVADAVMVKAGSIALDTSKSLKGLSEALNSLKARYSSTVDNILINGSATSTAGYRTDLYIETQADVGNESSDSLI